MLLATGTLGERAMGAKWYAERGTRLTPRARLPCRMLGSGVRRVREKKNKLSTITTVAID